MDVAYEFIEVVLECFREFIKYDNNIGGNLRNKAPILLVIIFLSIVIGLLTYKSTILWNKKVHNRSIFFVLALLSFFMTILFMSSFNSLTYLKVVSNERIEKWYENVRKNSQWQSETFRMAFYTVKEKGEESFEGYITPEQGGTKIPINIESSRLIVAKIYVTQSIKQFKMNHPYLSKILKANLRLPEAKIYHDINAFVKNNPDLNYDLLNGLKIAVDMLKISLKVSIPTLIKISQQLIIFGYIVIIFLVLAMVGIFSCREIKIIN